MTTDEAIKHLVDRAAIWHPETPGRIADEAIARLIQSLARDAARLDWFERWITDNAHGGEIFPIGPDLEFGADGDTVVDVLGWDLANKRWPVKTLREAIDGAMRDQTA